MIHIKTDLLNINIILSQRRKGQRRLEGISLAIFMLDILVEYLQKRNKHYLVSLHHYWLLDNDINSCFAIDIIVMFEYNEILSLKIEFSIDKVNVKGL